MLGLDDVIRSFCEDLFTTTRCNEPRGQGEGLRGKRWIINIGGKGGKGKGGLYRGMRLKCIDFKETEV